MHARKILFLSLALTVAAGASARPLGELRRLSDAEKGVVVRSVEEILKDADSAKFRWFQYNGHNHYCGQINGKNSYGGYTGYSHFLVDVEKDKEGRIIKAANPQIYGPDAPAVSVMRLVCEVSAKADSEDKIAAPAEP